MKGLKSVTIAAAVLNTIALLLLNLPGRATLFGSDLHAALALVLPLLPMGLGIAAALRSDLRIGIAAGGLMLLLAAAAKVPALSVGAVLFALSFLLFVETLTAGHRFTSFEAEARRAGAEPSITAKEASGQYLRFAWWPLTLTALVALGAIAAHLLLPLVERIVRVPGLARYAEAAEAANAYGIVLFGLAALGLFGLVVLARARLAKRRRA